MIVGVPTVGVAGQVRLTNAAALAVGSIGGAGGALLALALPGAALRIVFAVFRALVGARLVHDAARTQQ